MGDAWTEYNPPRLVGFIACEDVAASVRGEDVFSIHRINYSLLAVRFPAVFYRVTFAHLWAGGDEGASYQVTLRLVDPEGNEAVRHSSGLVGAPGAPDPALIVTFFHMLRIERAGRYRVELLVDDELVFHCPLMVIGPPAEAEVETSPGEEAEAQEPEEREQEPLETEKVSAEPALAAEG